MQDLQLQLRLRPFAVAAPAKPSGTIGTPGEVARNHFGPAPSAGRLAASGARVGSDHIQGQAQSGMQCGKAIWPDAIWDATLGAPETVGTPMLGTQKP